MKARNNRLKGTPILAVTVVMIAVTGCVRSGIAQSLQDGWKGIKPLMTTRGMVESILGRPDSISKDGLYWYKTAEATFRVNYSVEPCTTASFSRGEFNVPINTVLEYNVWPKNLIELSSLVFDPTTFHKDTSGDVVNSWSYYNHELNVIISGKTRASDGKDFVGTIWFRPGKSEADKVRCKTVK